MTKGEYELYSYFIWSRVNMKAICDRPIVLTNLIYIKLCVNIIRLHTVDYIL